MHCPHCISCNWSLLRPASLTVCEITCLCSQCLHYMSFFGHQNITTLRVSITDINDNAPVFSSKTYSKSILVKDTKIGDLLLTLYATDRDAGNNSLLTYRYTQDIYTH